MAVHRAAPDVVQVQAPNGVVWTRKPEGRSSPADLLWELADLGDGHIEREWDWWQEGRRDQEHDRQWAAVLAEWENGGKDPPAFDPEAAAKAYMEDFDRHGRGAPLAESPSHRAVRQGTRDPSAADDRG